MGTFEEFDRLIGLNPTTEVKKYDDEHALQERIYEWLETPQGSLADLPSWGHNLGVIKHEPQGVNLEVVAEMSIASKMPRDIEDLSISGVSVQFSEIDRCKVTINYRFGTFSGEVAL